MGVVLKRARFFLTCSGKYYGDNALEPVYIRDRILESTRAVLRAPETCRVGEDKSVQVARESRQPSRASSLLEPDCIRRKLTDDDQSAQISMFESLGK
jgi:hypothetical protein